MKEISGYKENHLPQLIPLPWVLYPLQFPLVISPPFLDLNTFYMSLRISHTFVSGVECRIVFCQYLDFFVASLVGFGEEAHVSLTSCLKVFRFVKVYSSDVLKTYINAMVYYTFAL